MKKLLLAAILFLAVSPEVFAKEAMSAVLDRNGDPVRSVLSGECVRHDFEQEGDPCAPPAPPAPEPVAAPAPPPAPEPVALLTKEELTVYFDFNKSKVRDEGVVKLNNLIQALVASEGVESLSIVGYADRIGSNDYNLKLSKKRMQAVENYLNERVNIPTQILQAEAKGETNSVTSCGDKEKRKALISCLAADRRVEIVLNYYTMQ